MSGSADKLREELKWYSDRQALLLEITQRIAKGGSLSAMLPNVTYDALKGVQADGIRVIVGEIAVPLTYATGPLTGKMVKFDQLIANLVIARGRVEVPDLTTLTPDDSALQPLQGNLGALMALPLDAQQTARGLLWIAYEKPHPFTDGERTFISIVAGQTAVAIANAQAFNAARRGREQLAAILTSSVDPILVITSQETIVLLNPAAEHVFGLKAETLVGKPIGEVLNAPPLVALLSSAQEQQIDNIEWQNADGQTFAPRVSDICNDDGERTGRVLILRDITRYKKLRESQSVFVSTVTHDLKSPLTFMHGYATMLPMVGELNKKQKEFADKILIGVDQMKDLVENILDAGRLDHEFELKREPCDVQKIVFDLVNTHLPSAEKKGLILISEVNPSVPILNLDDTMMRRALNNLVDNAIKYTPEKGHVTVSASVHDGSLWLQVKDTGLGISQENQKHLFQLFQRVRRREHQAVKGSGLGLFIVRGIAIAHGGDATIESQEDKGSTFTIRIPLEGTNLLNPESKKA